MPKNNIFQALLIACLGIFIFLFFFGPVETEDIWWHLSTGQWIAAHGQVPHEDIFPFGHEKLPWLCNGEWLGSVVLFGVFKAGGLLGLRIFRSLFFVMVAGLIFFYARRQMSFPLLMALVLMAVFGLSNRGWLRPDLFNFLFIPIFLMVLFDYEETGDHRRLWILPLLSLIWFNAHLGGFIYGMLLLFIFSLSAFIRCLKVEPASVAQKATAKGQALTLTLTGLACLAGFIINPYGLEGFLYPFKVFLFSNFIGYHKLKASIVEMQPPGYIFTSFHYFYYFVLLAGGILVLIFNKKNNFTLILLLLFSFFAFLYMQRNSAFFVLAGAYVIAVGARHVKFNAFWQNFRYAKIINGVLTVWIALFLLTQIFSLWNQRSYFYGRVINNLSMDVYPPSDASIKLLINNRLHGAVFTQENFGDQILWLGYPGLRPLVDGRNTSQERYNNAMSVYLNPKETWPMAERDYNLKIVLLDAVHAYVLPLIDYLNGREEWQLISVEGSVVIYVKRNEFHLPEALDGFEASLKSQKVSPDDVRKLRTLIRLKHVSALSRFLNPPVQNVDVYSTGLTLFGLGYKGAAVEHLARGLQISSRPEMQNTARFILEQIPEAKGWAPS
jgi:hypothetical protein